MKSRPVINGVPSWRRKSNITNHLIRGVKHAFCFSLFLVTKEYFLLVFFMLNSPYF